MYEHDKKDRGAKATVVTITYPVQQVELDTDNIPFSAFDYGLASFPNLFEGIETPGATFSKCTEDGAQVVTNDHVHEKGTVDETGAVKNVVVLGFDILL